MTRTERLTTDPDDPRLGHGVDAEPTGQNEVYLVLSDEEIAKGFVRPYRNVYRHVGLAGPRFPLRGLTEDEKERWGEHYAKFEPYPEENQKERSGSYSLGRFWTQEQLDSVGQGCGAETRMGYELSATSARSPAFYSATFCVGCNKHLPVAEFVWVADGARVGS